MTTTKLAVEKKSYSKSGNVKKELVNGETWEKMRSLNGVFISVEIC
jgi:hypothetical protein